MDSEGVDNTRSGERRDTSDSRNLTKQGSRKLGKHSSRKFNTSGSGDRSEGEGNKMTDLLGSEAEDFEGTHEDSSAVVTARGTSDGLLLRIDGRRDVEVVERSLREFMTVRRRFLEGQELVVEWVGRESTPYYSEVVTRILEDEFSVVIAGFRVRRPITAMRGGKSPTSVREKAVSLSVVTPRQAEKSIPSRTLFDGVDSVMQAHLGGVAVQDGSSEAVDRERAAVGTNPELWDDPDARVVYATLRSGQRIETEHTLVLFGDVNSGAEVVAGGDIVVLGSLRGVAHAGAYEETGGGRIIMAMSLEPTQLRIGTVITRGGSEAPARSMLEKVRGSKSPELARVDGDTIVVEPYRSKTMAFR